MPVARSSDWFLLRVELVSGASNESDAPPGRDFLIGTKHTLGQLAEAIDIAFARWDLSHLHLFHLPGGRLVSTPNPEWDMDVEDEDEITVASITAETDEFTYEFDLGDSWMHRCHVVESDMDPGEVYGAIPSGPVPIFGWGAIPDQYGRDRPG